MGIFRQFPYSNFHNMNMDEIIKICKELQVEWETVEQEWTDMQTFITEYFANLNLDEETERALRALIKDGTLDTVIDPVIAQQVTAWLNEHIEPTTPAIDTSLTVHGAAADAWETGTRISMLADNTVMPDDITVFDINDGHYWNSTDGTLGDSGSFMCSANLIPVEPGSLFVSESGQNVNIACYGAQREYLGSGTYITCRPANGTNSVFEPIPKNCHYIGLNTAHNASLTSIKLRRIKGTDVLQYPFTNGGDYIFINNGIYTDDGIWQSTNGFFCCMMPVKAGEKFVTNARYGQNFCCWDANYNILGAAPYVDDEYYTRIVTIPSGAVKIAFNFNKTHYHGAADEYSTVVYKLTQNTKILAIGDSITWLNNRQGYNDSNRFWGWQKTLEAAGYQVTSAGYNGATVANDGTHDSIYDAIVTNTFDVTGYDIIILFMGTNDNLYEIPVGNPLNTYYKTEFNETIFNEAYAGILRYIRDHNEDCKIIVATPIKSEAAIRNYNRAIPYVEAIRQLAEVYACDICDLFKLMNISPNTVGFAQYFYDNTHPNKAGMQRIGKQMLQTAINC